MNVYKIEILVIDHDELGSVGIAETIQNTKYPNRCIYPEVKRITVRSVEWSDDHPLNIRATADEFYRELFEK